MRKTVDRREFRRQSTSIALGGALLGAGAPAVRSQAAGLKKGACIGVLPKEMTVGQKFAVAKSAGFEGIEPNTLTSELPVAAYRVDGRTGQVDKVGDEFGGPNGICFSPDYRKLYVADTGAPRAIKVFDVDGRTPRNGRTFATLQIPGTTTPTVADGIRCDVDGNIWAGARPGVQVLAPTGELLGMIRLPETCANVCFGGAKRNRMFMTASQSLYAVYVNTAGAHIA